MVRNKAKKKKRYWTEKLTSKNHHKTLLLVLFVSKSTYNLQFDVIQLFLMEHVLPTHKTIMETIVLLGGFVAIAVVGFSFIPLNIYNIYKR